MQQDPQNAVAPGAPAQPDVPASTGSAQIGYEQSNVSQEAHQHAHAGAFPVLSRAAAMPTAPNSAATTAPSQPALGHHGAPAHLAQLQDARHANNAATMALAPHHPAAPRSMHTANLPEPQRPPQPRPPNMSAAVANQTARARVSEAALAHFKRGQLHSVQ